MFQFELDRLEKVSRKMKIREKAPVCLAEEENALKEDYKHSTVDTLCCGEPFLCLWHSVTVESELVVLPHIVLIFMTQQQLGKYHYPFLCCGKRLYFLTLSMIAFMVMSAIAADKEVCFLKLQQYLACLIE